MKAAVFLRNIGMFGTSSMRIRVSASLPARAWGCENLPAPAYTSIMGMGKSPFLEANTSEFDCSGSGVPLAVFPSSAVRAASATDSRRTDLSAPQERRDADARSATRALHVALLEK